MKALFDISYERAMELTTKVGTEDTMTRIQENLMNMSYAFYACMRRAEKAEKKLAKIEQSTKGGAQ